MPLRAIVLAMMVTLMAVTAATAQKPLNSRSRAKADAAKQLRELVLPPGATETSGDPSASSDLGHAPQIQVSNPRYVVDDHGFWTAPGSPEKVVAWMESHPPANAPGEYEGSAVSGVYRLGWIFRNTSRVVLRSLPGASWTLRDPRASAAPGSRGRVVQPR